jgi:ribonuclease HI
VKNRDLWVALDAAIDQHTYVEFTHIKGHSGNGWNERVDKLASKARKGLL